MILRKSLEKNGILRLIAKKIKKIEIFYNYLLTFHFKWAIIYIDNSRMDKIVCLGKIRAVSAGVVLK